MNASSPHRALTWIGIGALGVSLATLIRTAAMAGDGQPNAPTSAPEIGRRGGRLVVAQRAEPKTFNPLMAADAPSKEVIWRTSGDLIHINRGTQQTEPALATSWQVSKDGLHYTLELRRGVRFSNGDAFDADDVVFSFAAYQDPAIESPQRELLTVAGKPIGVRKLGPYTVAFDLAAPYAAAERLFDSVAMLPRHVLESVYREGRLGEAWGVGAPPSDVVGLGPFRLKAFRPGEGVVLERNPYFWKKDRAGTPLPYLDEIVWRFVPSEEAQVVRFQAGEIDVLNHVSPSFVPALERQAGTRGYRLHDLGAGLEYNFLFFNLTPSPDAPRIWTDRRFRQAVSLAIDRAGVIRLVFDGRATPLWGHVTPGNRLWLNTALPTPSRSVPRARALLQALGCSWAVDGALLDPQGRPVKFTVLAAAGNTTMNETATIVQADLETIGIRVQVVPLEFRSLLDRVLRSRDYEAVVLRLGSGDVDPTNEMNVWMSSGATHLWNPDQPAPATGWEAEIDRLMEQQKTAKDPRVRKRLYDRVQEIVATELPIIPLVSPNLIVGVRGDLGNFRPAVLDHYSLWNVEDLYWRRRPGEAPR